MNERINLIKDTIALGELIRQRRKALSLSQQDAAALCNVSTPFLSMLENGKSSVHFQKVLSVLHGLGLELSAVDRGLKRVR